MKQNVYQFVFSPHLSSQRRCHLVGSQVPSTWWAAAPRHPLSPVGSSSWSRRPLRDQSRPPWSHHQSQSWGGGGGRGWGITSVEIYITGVNLKAGENTVWKSHCHPSLTTHNHTVTTHTHMQFLAARSRCINLSPARYSIPLATCRHIGSSLRWIATTCRTLHSVVGDIIGDVMVMSQC